MPPNHPLGLAPQKPRDPRIYVRYSSFNPPSQVRAIGAIEAIGNAARHPHADRLPGGLPGQ